MICMIWTMWSLKIDSHRNAAGLEGTWRAAWRRPLAQCRCTNNNMRCVSRLEIFNIYSTQYIQHVRLFWAAHLSMQRLQLFRQDSTNPRKLKPNHKRIQKAAGIEDSPAQASHDGAEADPKQGGHHLSAFQFYCIPALRSRLLRKMDQTNISCI